jgi:hypothetical protein
MVRGKSGINRRGRRPSLRVAARKAEKLQRDVRSILNELSDLQERLTRLDALIEASRKAEKQKARQRAGSNNRGIRGRGPNVRDIAYQYLSRRRKAMGIQEIAAHVLRSKKGKAGANFTQNLGAALARDSRFVRVGRGIYTVKR